MTKGEYEEVASEYERVDREYKGVLREYRRVEEEYIDEIVLSRRLKRRGLS